MDDIEIVNAVVQAKVNPGLLRLLGQCCAEQVGVAGFVVKSVERSSQARAQRSEGGLDGDGLVGIEDAAGDAEIL